MTRFFTPDEANALLPRVRPLAEAMVRAREKLAVAEGAASHLHHSVSGNGGGIDPDEVRDTHEAVDDLRAQLGRAVAALEDLGVQVKDPARGLVDFPWEREGEVVLLCWHLGEERVAYWHRTDDGFAGRQPL